MAAHSLGLSDPISICFAELYTGGRGEAPAAAASESPEIDVSDYVKLDDFSCLTVAAGESQNPAFPDEANCGMVKRKRVEGRIGFRTRSDVEILDDGFKWRKYGKKSVKNSPNPRNYYRCSSQGCMVKKRVERDRIDPSYVITTYEGKHDHESPNLRHQSYIDSSSWGSCAHEMPGAPIHSCNGLFAPFSYN